MWKSKDKSKCKIGRVKTRESRKVEAERKWTVEELKSEGKE